VPQNKRMKLAVALASAPRVNTAEGHSACPLFSGHRAPAAYAWCSTDIDGLTGEARPALAVDG
jgi:hypothetical protein